MERHHDPDAPAIDPPRAAAERALRARLGVPEGASRVLIFGETSHWDPNWLWTSEAYWRWPVERTLDEVIAALEANPRRVYALECVFFLRMYWERRPEQRSRLRRLINTRQLRLTGTGLTTPDTLLPHTEALLRDYLLGQRWLTSQGLDARPRLAYLPDGFGQTPALPSLLDALDIDQTAITRIDGMYFVATDLRRRADFPLPGSSAARLEALGTQDFIWRAPDGAEALCHWNAFTYFQGDMIAYLGVIRWMGRVFGAPWRTRRHIARRIASYVQQLRPLSRTPYMFCPIGCDFTRPIPDLVDLLDRYNETSALHTGVWAVCAGLDDYMMLVDARRDALPTLRLDPNPYWMGFYASRPEVKARHNALSRGLLEAEHTLASATLRQQVDADQQEAITEALTRAWDRVACANHHDFITGTSPDAVWHDEQRPWLDDAEEQLTRACALLGATAPAPPPPPPGALPDWWFEGDVLHVDTGRFTLRLDARRGGCVVSLIARDRGELLAGPANDLVAYHDTGGLWRLGHEYRGGALRARARASDTPARVRAEPLDDGLLEVRVISRLLDQPFTRTLWLTRDAPLIRLRSRGAAPQRVTVTTRWPTRLRADALRMDTPGGLITRPRARHHEPTFWPARTFVQLLPQASTQGLAVALGGPATAAVDPRGGLEWITLRDVPRERAFGLVPLLAHPARGSDPDPHTHDAALLLTDVEDLDRPGRMARRAEAAIRDPLQCWSPRPALEGTVRLDRDDVRLLAFKPADDGDGVIARLERFSRTPVTVRLRLPGVSLACACRCDAREHDGTPLTISGDGRDTVTLSLDRSIVSLRLRASA